MSQSQCDTCGLTLTKEETSMCVGNLCLKCGYSKYYHLPCFTCAKKEKKVKQLRDILTGVSDWMNFESQSKGGLRYRIMGVLEDTD